MDKDPTQAALLDELAACRVKIDQLDAELLSVLAERFSVTRRVGAIKRTLALPAVDPDREQAQRQRIRTLAREAAIDEQLALDVLDLVIDRVVSEHSAL